jgi:hypothetical protein
MGVKLVPDLPALNCYPYSGHSALTGMNHHPWQDTDYVLRTFGASPAKRDKRISRMSRPASVSRDETTSWEEG